MADGREHGHDSGLQARPRGVKVRDAERSKDFYTRTLGLKVAYESPGAVFLSFGVQHHDLALFQLATVTF